MPQYLLVPNVGLCIARHNEEHLAVPDVMETAAILLPQQTRNDHGLTVSMVARCTQCQISHVDKEYLDAWYFVLMLYFLSWKKIVTKEIKQIAEMIANVWYAETAY